MWPSRFLSITSLLVGVAGTGCGDDECGPGSGNDSALAASSAEVSLQYTGLSALAGNDCPAADAPAGVISLSIEGRTADGTGLLTLCVPRPDLLTDGNRTLGTSLSMADVRIFDLTGTANGCTFALDSTRPPSGTAIGFGVCGNGTDASGFALAIDGAVSLRRTCGATIDPVSVTLTGRVPVAARAQ
jgi:hypothetical protein